MGLKEGMPGPVGVRARRAGELLLVAVYLAGTIADGASGEDTND